ncbi:MAG: PRC-barrel domain-containing protein [Lysobacter sp.]
MVNTAQHLSASSLIGDSIKNPQGESLGDLKELMIDLGTGNVGYAVVAFGGVLGMGEKLFAVPWQALKVDHQDKCLVLNVSADRLKDAPGFDKDNWPNFSDPAFTQNMSTYYQS